MLTFSSDLEKDDYNQWLERAQQIVVIIKKIEGLQQQILEHFQKGQTKVHKQMGKVHKGNKLLGSYKRGLAVPVKPTPRFIDEDS